MSSKRLTYHPKSAKMKEKDKCKEKPMKTKKPQPLVPPVITETSTEEERALAADFNKKRFTALIMRSVFIGVTLLACLFSLFLPCVKRTAAKSFDTDYSLTLSIADEFFGTFSLNSALQADVDSFIENGGRNLISLDDEGNEKRKSASEEQILADVAYKRKLSFSKIKAQYDVGAFIAAIDRNMRKGVEEIEKIVPKDKLEEKVREFYAETRITVGAVFDLFSYEIERNNYAGLGKVLDTVEYDLTETTFRNAAEKFLIGKYKWSEAFETKLKTAVAASSVLPELQDEFFLNEELPIRLYSDEGDIFQLLFSIIIGGLDMIVLINLIIKGIFLFRQFRKQDAPLRSSWTMVFLLFCLVPHLIMALFAKDASFAGVFSAGTIVIALFTLLAIAAQTVYNWHLSKMRDKFFPEADGEGETGN